MPGPTWILPYPAQLPQNYYQKGLSPAAPSTPTVPTTTTPNPVPISTQPPIASVNSGGIYYGDLPPTNPQYGWLWTNRQGVLYVYMEPGVWSQIGTNW